MRPADRTDYIVRCLMEGGSMYEDGARSFLAEHDAEVLAGEPTQTAPSTTTQRIEYALTSPAYTLHGPYLIQARDLREAELVAADEPGSQIVQRTVTTTTTPWTKAGEAR
jgi:hypothetical protein